MKMKIKRIEFLDVLNKIIYATNKTEILEQSNCFIFNKKEITAFNGEIYAKIQFESPWEFAVVANDLIQVISKFPDEEINMEIKENQLIVKGKKKRAGLTIQNEISLPIEDLPQPTKMKKIPKNLMSNLKIAAEICQLNNENYKVSHVYVTKNQIVATDRYRFIRIKMKTGIERLLIPASAIISIDETINEICENKGWLFLNCKKSKILYAVCCSSDEYVEDELITDVLDIKDSSPVQFPKEMANVIDRAMVMAKDDHQRLAKISLSKTSVIIRTQKDTGWYEEKQPVRFKGEDMKILISLPLFKGLLSRTSKAKVTEEKIKMEKDGLEFVTALGE